MKKIQINDINNINKPNKPLYILVAGAIGAGKSTVVEKYLSEIEVIDPDIFTVKLGRGKYDATKVATSMAMVKELVKHRLVAKETFIQQGTSANLKSTINKLKEAKRNDFETVLLYIDTDINQCILNVSNRTERSEIPDEKILRTYNGSRIAFDLMSNNLDGINESRHYVEPVIDHLQISLEAAQALTDYTIHYKNFS